MNVLRVAVSSDYKGALFHHLAKDNALEIPLVLEPGMRHEVVIPIEVGPGWELVLGVRPARGTG